MHYGSQQDIVITYLKRHPEHLSVLARWAFEAWGNYNPSSSLERTEQKLRDHLNEKTLPIAYIALHDNKPVGMCSLRQNDGVRVDLLPWLGSLFVVPEYRNQGIAVQLIDTIKQKAAQLDYSKLYLLTFESSLPSWYQKLGWKFLIEEQLNDYPVSIMEIDL